MTSGSLWNYKRDKINDEANENNTVYNKIKKDKTITSKSFEYKTKIIGRTPADNNTLDSEVVVPLRYLSNFWRSLDLPLINCEIELNLSWSNGYIKTEILIAPRIPGNPYANPPVQEVAVIQTTGETFQINNAKLCVPVVTLLINVLSDF